MRVRITRRPEGEVDGLPLSGFSPGKIYDMNASVATYLIVMGWAGAVADYPPAEIVPINLTRELGNAVRRAKQDQAVRHATKEAERTPTRTARKKR
jgi:hypothetical protein